ncbi:glycosyltransferase 87 family protein [Embleya sp. NBC_00896]|uniref:glycosyltransferase 87 family protein n=1 Tax=Embleya sp. NBC_00896 TaxID=2975961 RepID=UPI003867DF21|nr:glycosyltransferase 87 family protein [Embleya sp. NBC_00896]
MTVYLLLGIFGPADMWWLGDLRVYREGGVDVLAGHGELYTIRPKRLPFTYTPWAGLMFTPLAWLPWGAVEVLGVVANLALLGTATWLAWGIAGLRGDRVRATALTAAVLLWTEPVQENLRFGQINLLLLVLVLSDFARARGSRLGGVGVGIAAGLKLTPAIFIPYMLLTGRVREGLTALGVFLGTIAAAFAVLPRECADYWGGLFMDDTRIGLAQFPGNQSLNGAVTRQFGAETPPEWLWPVLAVSVALVGITLAVATARGGAALAGMGLCALTALLVSPISWTHHWVWALPLVIVLVDRAWRTRARPAVAALAAVFAIAAAYPMHRARTSGVLPGGVVWTVPFGDGRELDLHGWELIASSAYVLGALGVLAVGVYALIADGRAVHLIDRFTSGRRA